MINERKKTEQFKRVKKREVDQLSLLCVYFFFSSSGLVQRKSV